MSESILSRSIQSSAQSGGSTIAFEYTTGKTTSGNGIFYPVFTITNNAKLAGALIFVTEVNYWSYTNAYESGSCFDGTKASSQTGCKVCSIGTTVLGFSSSSYGSGGYIEAQCIISNNMLTLQCYGNGQRGQFKGFGIAFT